MPPAVLQLRGMGLNLNEKNGYNGADNVTTT